MYAKERSSAYPRQLILVRAQNTFNRFDPIINNTLFALGTCSHSAIFYPITPKFLKTAFRYMPMK